MLLLCQDRGRARLIASPGFQLASKYLRHAELKSYAAADTHWIFADAYGAVEQAYGDFTRNNAFERLLTLIPPDFTGR